MFWGDPWNPVPLQARQGLLNEQFGHYPDFAHGCFDQASVPPVWMVNGRMLVRTLRQSGVRSAIAFWLQIEHVRRKFGPIGETMWRELLDQEFCWNRDQYSGMGWGGNGEGGSGFPFAYALWREWPNPGSRAGAEEAGIDLDDPFAVAQYIRQESKRSMLLGTCIYHYGITLTEFEVMPKWHSWSLWAGQPVPGTPGYMVNEDLVPPFLPPDGYPLWVHECKEHPTDVGKYVSPYALEPIVFEGVGNKSYGTRQIAVPYWF